MKERLTYAEQLKHPLWKKKTRDIRERDDFKCVKCGAENKILHIHHTSPLPDILAWEYPNYTLLALCEDCHAWETMYERIFVYLTGYRYWIGATLEEKDKLLRIKSQSKSEAIVIFENMVKKSPLNNATLLKKLKSILNAEESKSLLTNSS